MEERIKNLEKENMEIKKILASMLNCIATIAESTSYGTMMKVDDIITYCNNGDLFKNL